MLVYWPVMEENSENITSPEQIDRDILQCKADILAARQSSEPAKKGPIEQEHTTEPAQSQVEDEIDIFEANEAIESTLQIETDEGEEEEGPIPRFNLAEQILKEQRKVASTRRGRPAGSNGTGNTAPVEGTIGKIISESKKSPPVEPIFYEGDRPAESKISEEEESPATEPIEFYESIGPDESDRPYYNSFISNLDPAAEQIISEIVAEDLEKLCSS
jgi:hypothetical protein